MNAVSNGEFAIAVIPECCAYSVTQWAQENNLKFINNINTDNLDWYLPYRASYDRIIRGIAADLHGIMLDQNIVDLNTNSWLQVEETAMEFIRSWIKADHCEIPIVRKDLGCHSGLYQAYTNSLSEGIFFDVAELDLLPAVLNKQYNLNLTNTVPELPDDFYLRTVPYWYIDELYKTNKRLAEKIDDFCSIYQTYPGTLTKLADQLL
jgi:hypothetical protein